MTLPAIRSYKNVIGNVPGDLRFRWIENFGTLLVKEATIYIGSLGVPINKLYGEWILIWNELTLPEGKKAGFGEMINHTSKLYIPLEFWFCRNVGLALPLIALQYSDVVVNITFLYFKIS